MSEATHAVSGPIMDSELLCLYPIVVYAKLFVDLSSVYFKAFRFFDILK